MDNKHSVFGRVVGGMESLSSMEAVGTDNQDRPIEDVVLQKAVVFVDPFTEVDEQVRIHWLSDRKIRDICCRFFK